MQRVFSEALARKTSLRDGLTSELGADVALTILFSETYNLLLHSRGWSRARWRGWAFDALVGLLTTLPRPVQTLEE
ncbi:hypothetical protein [Nonomuraea insulae]|uniref:Uncharacterized protein n=1 Tax=Nonomuraea insulae TaxID=1616787 RepID=A0ABW1CV60_9ACTN